jgi:predicted N-formylglutamate amidohydrolase
MADATSSSPREVREAFEAHDGSARAPVFVTCEHASMRLPEGYGWHPRDERLVGSHWAYDLGAAELATELAAALLAPAVLSRFSRLLVDPNRPEDSETLFRTHAEGEAVELNRALPEAERRGRIEAFHRP